MKKRRNKPAKASTSKSTPSEVEVLAGLLLKVTMHELSLCEDIIHLLQERAAVDNFKQIKTIQLDIGKLSCVEADALIFAFDVVAKGTLAENAQLEVNEVSGLGWCKQCASVVAVEQRFDACPDCDYYPLEIQQGDEMKIKHIEVI